jgi:nitroimidazol reductase NimA-like FMN-containing flavoprotein (pyridoxamine 5'-phosphate oxidase superfamily)
VRVRRQPSRGRYERADIDSVLDRGFFAHVAFVDDGQPYCIPMLHARAGDQLYVHGSSASRAMRALAAGAETCVTVTLLHGLVLARSVFEHSANYESAILLGRFRLLEAEAERLGAMEAFTDKLLPGRWSEVRPPDRKELKATMICAMDISEASVKARSGPPSDDDTPDAAQIDAWAGVVPIHTSFGIPQASPGLRPGIPMSASVERLIGEQEEAA